MLGDRGRGGRRLSDGAEVVQCPAPVSVAERGVFVKPHRGWRLEPREPLLGLRGETRRERLGATGYDSPRLAGTKSCPWPGPCHVISTDRRL
jgi:hypothetical protein